MIEFLVGMTVGGAIMMIALNKVNEAISARLKDYQYFSDEKVNGFLEAFEKGFEAKNGMKPFYEEKEAAVYQLEDTESMGIEIDERPLEPVYEERIDGVWRD